MWFTNFIGEEEGAAISLDMIIAKANELATIEWNSQSITCLTPAGKPYTLPDNIQELDFTSNTGKHPYGALLAFTTDNKTYVAVYDKGNNKFLGYAELIDPDAGSIKDNIKFKDEEKSVPQLRIDNQTKQLTENSKVILGKIGDCAINIYQFNYSEITNKSGVTEEDYCGGGSYNSNPLPYDTQNKTPIVVGDNTACLNKYAKEFYQAQENAHPDYKETLRRIAGVLNSIEDNQSDKFFEDYEKYCSKEGSVEYYGYSELWGTPDDFKLFEKALRAYISHKDTLEQLILAEDNRDKLTDMSWLLVDKYSQSISYEVRLHILDKLREENMYGNQFFGNGQEYLALRLIASVPEEKEVDFLNDIKKDGLLKELFNRIDDEMGGDNFTAFIMLLSEMAMDNIDKDEIDVMGAPLFTWDGDLSRTDKHEIDFNENGDVTLESFEKEESCYTSYYSGQEICNEEWVLDKTFTLSPFTFIPVKFPDGERYLKSIKEGSGNINFVPVIYLKAQNEKRLTDIKKKVAEITIDVASLCFGVGELNAALKAIKNSKNIYNLIRVAALTTEVAVTSGDIGITLAEDVISDLEGGPEFLGKWNTFSALAGLVTFSADNLTQSPEALSNLSGSWRKLKKTYKDNPKAVVNAVGGRRQYESIENSVKRSEEILEETGNQGSSINDFNQNYQNAIDNIAENLNKNVIGKPISNSDEAPLGYQFYQKNGKKWIRRLDASDPETPKLTVKDGKIVRAGTTSKLADNLTGLPKQAHSNLVDGGVDYKDNGNNIKYYLKNGDEFAKIEGNEIVLTTSNGQWPDPSEYLVDEYIENHLNKFNDEASFLVPEEAYKNFIKNSQKIGYPDGQFISTRKSIDEILEKAKGDISIIEDELGITPGAWQAQGNKIYRIDLNKVDDNLDLRIPKGSESGAGDKWIPGGYTPQKRPEAVVNQIPNTKAYVNKYPVIEN